MWKLAGFLIRNFLPIFLGALTFFVILINLSDLFLNIIRYIEQNVAFSELLRVQLLYLPQCFVFALPIALLFSVSFTMGSLYANNELIAVFASGVGLRQFIFPLACIGFVLCIGLFFVQDRYAIPLLKSKDELSRQLLNNAPVNLDQSNVTIQSLGGRVIYQAGYYDSANQRITNVTAIIRDENFRVETQVQAEWADWREDLWEFNRSRVTKRIEPDSTDGAGARSSRAATFTIEDYELYRQEDFSLEPSNFENQFGDIEEMTLREANEYIRFLRSSGFPFRKQLTRYHERYSFSFTPLVVTLLSAAIGGRYKKNILGLSLLSSLGISVVYYCLQLFTGLLATVGVVNSIVGAWAGVIITALLAMVLLKYAKS